MSKRRILIVAAMCFVLLGTVAAGRGHRPEPKPDSIVTCLGAGNYVVLARSAPASVDLGQCSHPPDFAADCSSCIRSLENQGCSIVDVTVTNTGQFGGEPLPGATFLLSCEKP